MKTTKKIAAALAILLGAGATCAAFILSPNRPRAASITSKVLNLPVGTSKSQVASLLAKEAVEHSFVSGPEGIAGTSAVAKNGFSPKNLSGYIVAIIRNTSGGFIVSGDTQYYFFFDKQGRLLKTTATDVFTGP